MRETDREIQGMGDGREDKGNKVGRRSGKERRKMFLLHFIQKYVADKRWGCGTGQKWIQA